MSPIPPHPRVRPATLSAAIGTSRTSCTTPAMSLSGKINPASGTIPGIFARLRSFAYNILQRNRTSTFSQERYAAALGGLDALLKLRLS